MTFLSTNKLTGSANQMTFSWLQFSTSKPQILIKFLVPTVRLNTTNDASSKTVKNDLGPNSVRIYTPRSMRLTYEKYKK